MKDKLAAYKAILDEVILAFKENGMHETAEIIERKLKELEKL